MALADVYDALRTRRAYKEPYTHEKAVKIIREGRGAHFDPDVVDAFLNVEGDFVKIAQSFEEPQLLDATSWSTMDVMVGLDS